MKTLYYTKVYMHTVLLLSLNTNASMLKHQVLSMKYHCNGNNTGNIISVLIVTIIKMRQKMNNL